MRFLLDTHAFIWYSDSPERIPDRVLRQINDRQNDVYLSIASVWELAIKTSIGRLTLSTSPHELVADQLNAGQIELINIDLNDISVLETLPFHHRDPFDRLLIAQASARGLVLASVDTKLDDYHVIRLW